MRTMASATADSFTSLEHISARSMPYSSAGTFAPDTLYPELPCQRRHEEDELAYPPPRGARAANRHWFLTRSTLATSD